jgi:hexosaminidase
MQSVEISANTDISIIPQPASLVSLDVEESRGVFRLTADTEIWADKATQGVARQLKGLLDPATGYDLKISAPGQPGKKLSNLIILGLSDQEKERGEEGYRLMVLPNSAVLTAYKPAGLFYACQSLRQLLPTEIFSDAKVKGVEWVAPCVRIEDRPRFGWRGMHLDVCRHFMPTAFVKKYIDLLAAHKMNRFHWHLTEDQGWRIEIKKYPKLTEIGAWRAESLVGHYNDKPRRYDGKRHGGFYTQEEVRDIVRYAADRYITVVPEIEMPGHAQAAIAAYPELGNTGKQLPVWVEWGVNPNIYNANDSTIAFLQDVLTEVLDLFPSEFIHIGGDEAPKDQWETSAQAQALIKKRGLKDEHELQSWFIRQMDAFLTEHGRRLIGWDEILEGGLAPGATVMSWRGEEGGIAAARAGHDVVMATTSHTYFDYYQADPKGEPLAIGGLLPLQKVYSYNPIPTVLTAEQAKHVLGAQGQIWTEYIPTPELAEYMAYPRACALAEVVWSPNGSKDYTGFLQRLKKHLKRLDRLSVNYRKLDK